MRIASLDDSSLLARRLCTLLVAAAAYLERRGRPTHPAQIAGYAALAYSGHAAPRTWRLHILGSEEAFARLDG